MVQPTTRAIDFPKKDANASDGQERRRAEEQRAEAQRLQRLSNAQAAEARAQKKVSSRGSVRGGGGANFVILPI